MVAGIPPGRVMTYADVAAATGRGGARSVGGVLSRCGQDLPCHRVVRSDGQVKRVDTERNARRLRAEGVVLVGGRVDLAAVRWLPGPDSTAPDRQLRDLRRTDPGHAGPVAP